MTIRQGGRPRDEQNQAEPMDERAYAAAASQDLDPRRTGLSPTAATFGSMGANLDLLSGNMNFNLPLLKAKEGKEMREEAAENDVNRLLLLVVTLLVVTAVFVTLGIELGGKLPNGGLVLGTLITSWLFGNVMFAQYYAFAYWIQDGKGGFDFPNSEAPDYADFTYLSFMIGMTFSPIDGPAA